MSVRAGYVITFPDGRRVASGENKDTHNRWINRLMTHFGAKVEWGPVVKRPRKGRTP